MRNLPRFTIIAVSILAMALAPLSPIGANQQSQESKPQKSAEQNQPSPEALEKLRRVAAQQKTYQVGYSPVMEQELRKLAGVEIPRGTVRQALAVRQEAKRRMAAEKRRIEKYYKNHPDEIYESVDVYEEIRRKLQEANPNKALPKDLPSLIPMMPAFNWNETDFAFAPVKDQNEMCTMGCWAFAASTALVYSYTIQLSRVRGSRQMKITLPNGEVRFVNLVGGGAPAMLWVSEEKMIRSVKGDNSCESGGWHGSAFNYMVKKGMAWSDNDDIAIKALTWDYVNYPPDKIPSVMQLKMALLEHGPIVALVSIDEAFKAYKGGVFNERSQGQPYHAVALIGWDDSKRAWLIQNSWGNEWGTKVVPENWAIAGFMWIAWDSNEIGKYAAWVDAQIDLESVR